ncbi:glycosyltransferase family 2 protein, partial [bacterium]|nr:glycosyltransferase family 2 protein [bacterium]
LIISDDGSTDSTAAIIDGYAKRDSRIKVITNDVNIGLIASLTKAHRLARGKYIARMDSDDISLPERLALQVAFLEAHPEIDIVGTYFNRIDVNGTCTQPNNQRVCGSAILWFRMFFYLQIVNASAMARREIFTRFNENGLEADFINSEDIAFWLRIGFNARFENIPIELYQIRSHPGRVTSLSNTVQMRSTEKAIQRGLRMALAREVSLDAIRCIREMKMDCSAPAAVEAIDYTYALYKWFRTTYPLTQQELTAVRRFLADYYFR